MNRFLNILSWVLSPILRGYMKMVYNETDNTVVICLAPPAVMLQFMYWLSIPVGIYLLLGGK
jgi:hypothetical protein